MKIFTSLLFAILFATAAVSAQSDIRKVDFKNFTYDPYCVGETTQKVTVKDGEFSKQTQEEGYVDRFYFNIFDVAYGDLTGDGSDEAVILSSCNTGGTGNFSEGFVYGMKGGKPALLQRIPGGDRAYGGLRSAKIDDGTLIVEANEVGEQGGACCPEFVLTSRYKLEGGKLAALGKSERRELYPKERISFAKGASGTTFTVTLAANDLKKYVIGAKSRQTLRVSINTGKASVALVGDTKVSIGVSGFMAVLPKTGDYVFELQNNEDKDLEVTVDVTISK